LLRFALLPILAFGLAQHSGRAGAQSCIGDCDGNGVVAVNEIILGVDILLGLEDVSSCPNLDDGSGMVTVSRLVTAVNNALCGCGGGCAVTPGPTTPSPTGPVAAPTPTPTEAASVSTWTVNSYDVKSSDCFAPIEGAVEGALRAVGSQFTVTESGNRVQIDYGDNNVLVGSVDSDGTVHVQETSKDSIGPCDYDVAFSASANLSNSPATATYDANVNLSGFCLGLSDCRMEITSLWTRLEGATASAD
jgi:hypothetical protein